jgi:hypothetical protein
VNHSALSARFVTPARQHTVVDHPARHTLRLCFHSHQGTLRPSSRVKTARDTAVIAVDLPLFCCPFRSHPDRAASSGMNSICQPLRITPDLLTSCSNTFPCCQTGRIQAHPETCISSHGLAFAKPNRNGLWRGQADITYPGVTC